MGSPAAPGSTLIVSPAIVSPLQRTRQCRFDALLRPDPDVGFLRRWHDSHRTVTVPMDYRNPAVEP